VLEHIKNNPRQDSVDICTHFKLRADITMGAINRLQQAGKIERVQPHVEAWYEYRWGLEAQKMITGVAFGDGAGATGGK
jgi:hypothetical protein